MHAPQGTAPLPRSAFALWALLALLALPSGPAGAQDLETQLWVPNGTVYATASFGDTIYAGGAFTEVGKATGGLASLHYSSGDVTPFPNVLGTVYAVIDDGTGGCYIGGQFTHVGGLPRENVAHISGAGVVTAWNPGANNEVWALCLSPNGGVYMGGSFSQVGGQARSRIAEVNANGSVAAFAPALNGNVRAITMFNGAVVVGGDFTMIGVTPRNRIAMLTTGGGLFTWNPNSLGPVHALRAVTHASVTGILVGGSFPIIGSFNRNNAAMLDPVTGLATAWNPNVNGPVYALGETTTDFYLGGSFTSVGGLACTNIAKVDDQAGVLNLSWTPNVNGSVHAVHYRSSTNSVVIAGTFSSVVGQARRGLTELDAASPGNPMFWNPRPNHDVYAVFDVGPRIVAGGAFTAANTFTRHRLAAFLRSTGELTAWNPVADNEVRAIALDVVGTSVRSVIVGGYFTIVGGTGRTKLAALHPQTGAATSWNVLVQGAGNSVRTFCLAGNELMVGGDFLTINGQSRPGACSFSVSSGALTSWNPNVSTPGAVVWAITATNTRAFLGGVFSTVGGQPRTNLACVSRFGTGAVDPWTASTNDYVFDLALQSGNIYAGGWFTTANGQPRNFAAAFDTSTGVLQGWNPNPNGFVHQVIPTNNMMTLGGSFDLVQGFTRRGVARVNPNTGGPDAFDPDVEGSVFALSLADGDRLLVGGAFQDVRRQAISNLALFQEQIPPTCLPSPYVSPAGTLPMAVASGEFDGDGIPDIVVGNGTVPGALTILRGLETGGVGNGTFAQMASLPVPGSVMQVVAADFDADGLDDVAATSHAPNGIVWIQRNLGGGAFGTPLEIPLMGRTDGIAAADVTNDGILDLAVCLMDSSGVSDRGGVQLLRGEGANGIWNGGFVPEWKWPADALGAHGRRLIVQDFNLDGGFDILLSGWGPTSYRVLKLDGTGQPVTYEYTLSAHTPTESGNGIVVGDVTGDSRADFVITGRRRVTTRIRTNSDLVNDFYFAAAVSTNLPSTPRDIALYDHNFDGKLDLICVMDSLDRVETYMGHGDGSFDPFPSYLSSMEAYAVIIGDFEANGSADLLVTNPGCGTVNTLPESNLSPLPMQLVLTSPNGGEVWAQLPFADGTNAGAAGADGATHGLAVGPADDEALLKAATPALAAAASPGHPILAAAQLVTWDKGFGIPSVNVDVSRDGGQAWQPIGKNQSGTALRWTVTPPASATALVRVRHNGVHSRVDTSDEWFDIVATTVDVEPGDGLPRVAAIRLLGANPVRGGAVAFRVDVPRAADVRVDVFDVAGRRVRTIARQRMDAGSHDLAWDVRAEGSEGESARAGGPPAGVYFVRALIGDVKTVNKFVVIR